VWPLHRQDRKGHSRLLTSGQRADLLQTRQTGDSERTQVGPVVLFDLAWELGLQERNGRHGRVELVDVVLRKVRNSATVVYRRAADRRLDRARQKLDECRFTGSVRPDDGDAAVEVDVDVDAA
jgi:hypothetical protein